MNPDQHKKTQFSIFYVVAGLLVILGLQWFLGGGLATDVAYSDFKAALAAGKVQERDRLPIGHPGNDDRRRTASRWPSTRCAWMSRTS